MTDTTTATTPLRLPAAIIGGIPEHLQVEVVPDAVNGPWVRFTTVSEWLDLPHHVDVPLSEVAPLAAWIVAAYRDAGLTDQDTNDTTEVSTR